MSQDTLRVIARLRAKPGKENELRTLAVGLLAPTRKEAGCIRYELLVNEADPAELTFVEEWRDGAALDAHLATAHVEFAVRRCPDLLVGELDLRRFKLVG
jgi:quinol monooxygenase YgiN